MFYHPRTLSFNTISPDHILLIYRLTSPLLHRPHRHSLVHTSPPWSFLGSSLFLTLIVISPLSSYHQMFSLDLMYRYSSPTSTSEWSPSIWINPCSLMVGLFIYLPIYPLTHTLSDQPSDTPSFFRKQKNPSC